MGNQELTNLLAEMVRTNATTRLPTTRQVTGLSQALLAQAPVQKPWDSGTVTAKDPRGPSVLNRIIDVMSRPLYGVMNATKGALERGKGKSFGENAVIGARLLSPLTNPDEMNDLWAGLSGKAKTTGKDLLATTGADTVLPKPAQALTAFGIDVLADPLTYAGGVGVLPKLGKGAKASTEALKALETGTGETAKTLAEQISERAAKQALDVDKVPPAPIARDSLGQQLALPSAENSVNKLDVLAPGPPKEIDALKVLEPGPPVPEFKFPTKKAMEDPLVARPEAPFPKTSPLEDIKALHEKIAVTKSPVAKNSLITQIEKLKAGVKPADVLSEVRVTPPEFPALTINQRWIDTAQQAAQSFLKTNRMKNINHVGQTNLYNKILHAASKVRKDRRPFHVLQMLRIAEEEVLKSGRHLTDAEGISVRLSDVANMLGGSRALSPKLVDDFRKARPSQQVEDLKAYTTPQVASEILDPVIKTGADIADATKDLPPSQTVQMGSELSRELGNIAEKAGASTREAKTAREFIHELFNPARDKLYSTVQQEARNLVRQTGSGVINPETMYKISKETYEALGENPKILGRQLQQNKVVEGMMTKFATWWGAKDLKPFSREYIDTARNVAAAFSEAMKPLVRSTTATQRKVAFSVAQGKIAAGSPEEAALANQFKYMVQRLMGTHGIDENAEAVVMRSGTVMKELNDELPKSLQFVTDKGKDTLGREFDYTNGKWMHSWEKWEVNEPAESLYQLTRAMQLVTRKNSMWDDAAVRWGLPQKGAEFQHEVKNIPRLKGTYFPKEIATQLDNLHNQLGRDVFKSPHKAIDLFDKVQRMWKTGVTIYSPSHHIRNLNGDIYLAALDGVVSPRPYAIATKVLHAFPSRYKDLESVFNIMDPGLRDRALRARPGNVVLTTKHGDKVTAEQLYQAAEAQGLFIRAMHVEDIMGDSAPALGALGAKFKPFGGKVFDTATKTSELRDHWVRLAHFADVITKSHQPLDVAIEQAARRVRKFHPDGMDMTGFEQNVLRRVIPFYSWMRKATPLVVEGAIMRPQITLAFPKAMADMQIATGIESQGPGDPFPMDQMFPDWLKEKGIGPILQPGSGLGRDETWRGPAPGYTIVNPSNPFMDQIAQLGSPGKTALSSLTPAARIPIELLTGQTSLGIPLDAQQGGTPGYLAQQIPALGIGARLTGMTRNNEPYNPEQLINWLTAAGVTGTGPYQQQGQTEIRNMLTQMAKKNRGDYR
jgi:hypothetical protein